MAGARKITTVIKERRGIVSVNMLLQRLTVLFEISKAWDQAPGNGGKGKKRSKKEQKKTPKNKKQKYNRRASGGLKRG